MSAGAADLEVFSTTALAEMGTLALLKSRGFDVKP